MMARDPTPLLARRASRAAARPRSTSEAIAASLAAGRPALLLVPEIALATPLVDRLRATWRAEVAVLHSGLGEGERADEWRRIRAGDVDVVVGTRTAVLAPLADVGLVIVDEEHDAAYKSDRTPRFQARDLAVTLGRAGRRGGRPRQRDAVGRDVWAGARAARYRRATLLRAPGGAAPVVDRGRPARGARRRQPRAALGALAGALSPRWTRTSATGRSCSSTGAATASVVLCRDCGHVQACPDCERPLVYHQAGTTLRCHHCGRGVAPMATRCPACASPRIRYLGGGTERVEREVRDRLPACSASARLDRDVVERRGAAERRARRVRRGQRRRPGRDEPGDEGPRRAGGHAGRRRLGRHRAQPPGRAGRRADVPAAGPGGRAGGSGRAARARVHPDLPARAPGDPGGRGGRRGCVLRRGAGARASSSGRLRSGAR